MAHDCSRPNFRIWMQTCRVGAPLILGFMIVGFTCLWGVGVKAQSTEPSAASSQVWTLTDKERIQRLITQGQAQQALSELLLFGSNPYGQAEFDYLLGVAALEAGQYSLALESLERVVLVHPQHAGAWLDLALVHYRLEDYEAARLMMRHVQEHFSPTPALTIQLTRLQRQLRWAPYTKDWLVELSAHMGYVRNANAGLNNLNFTLTPLGGLPISVKADERQSPRSDAAMLFRANAYRLVTHQGGAYSEWVLSAGARQYKTEGQYDVADLGAMWLYSQPWKGWEWQAGPSVREIVVGGRSIGEIYGVQTSLWNNWMGCRVAPRAEIEYRQYRESGYYSNWIPWLGGVMRCDRSTYMYGMSARMGLDQTQENRPGGNTQKMDWMVFGKYHISPSWSVDASLGYSKYKDKETYSQLVANGAARSIDRWVGRVGVDWQAKAWGYKNMYVSAYYDYYKDKSNIVFSNIQDKQLFIGLKYLIH